MQNASVFGQMSEFLSTVIKNVEQTLRKSDNVSVNINFVAKMSILCK